MILTHGSNSLQRGVEIGGRIYRTVKIGNQVWLAENLDFKFSGVEIGAEGTPTTPAAWYYNNNEATYGIDGTRKCGLLYNWYAAKLLNDNRATLCPGWHVPTSDEYNALVTAVGGTSTAGKKLKALDGATGNNWPSDWNGTDDYGFGVLPSGIYIGNFNQIGINAYFWTFDAGQSETNPYIGFNTADAIVNSSVVKSRGMSLRLVKDA